MRVLKNLLRNISYLIVPPAVCGPTICNVIPFQRRESKTFPQIEVIIVETDSWDGEYSFSHGSSPEKIAQHAETICALVDGFFPFPGWMILINAAMLSTAWWITAINER